MRKHVLVPVDDDFANQRKRSLVSGISYWAERRGIEIHIKTVSELSTADDDYEKYAFCYRVLTTLHNSNIRRIPKELPLVMDMSIPWRSPSNPFAGRRLALRNPFGVPVGYLQPEQQVPMLPQPLWPSDNQQVRDTIVFDVKQFHTAETHLYVASLLAAIANATKSVEEKLGFRLRYYFTSFFDYELYRHLFACIENNESLSSPKVDLWSIVQERLVPPCEDHTAYLDILRGARLLLTEHGDIADSDVTHALCCGVPTLTYKRLAFSRSNGFQCAAIRGVSLLDPHMNMRLKLANTLRVKEEWGCWQALSLGRVPSWDIKAYENTFLRSWDKLYDWAVNHVVDDRMNEAMSKGKWNKGVTYEAGEPLQARAISSYLLQHYSDKSVT